jgi:iron(III) transport system substrate-binding protein
MTGRCRPLLVAASLWAFCFGNVAASADEAALLAAARKEGEVTWYVASIDARNAEAAGHAFAAAYGPKVNVVSGPAPVMFQRLTQNLSRKLYNIDVFSSVDLGNFLTLKSQGALAAYEPANAARLLPLFRGLDKEATFHATVASLLVIAYNRDKIAPADAPTSWAALLDPKWTDKLVLAHPAFGIYPANWVMQVAKLYGKAYIHRLQEQRPQIARSLHDAAAVIAGGERPVTVSPAAPILEAADKGEPLAVEYPRDGAILVPTPSAILKTAPHPNAARLFMEYLLGPEFGELLVRAHYVPRRAGVPLPKGGRALTDIKIIRPTVVEMTNGIPQVTALWRDVFGQ